MPDVLEFNPNRDLEFDPERKLEFDLDRDLEFDPNDGLFFDPDRDLGFGKKGPVFRGYVCPVCNASVTETQPRCFDCGAVFEPDQVAKSRPKAAPPPPPPALPPSRVPPATPSTRSRAPPPPPVRRYPQTPKRVDLTSCVHCGAQVGPGDEFCWGCGNRLRTGVR